MTTERRNFYTRANQEAWEEVAPRHAAVTLEKLKADFAEPGHYRLGSHMLRALDRIPFKGARIAQLACNNGIDLLSVKNLGAGPCVGYDQSAAFIDQARELTRAAGLDAVEFEEADIYSLSPERTGQFDMVMTTIGVVGWMPDLQGFFDTASALVRNDGYFLMEEMHPVLLMFEPGDNGAPSYRAHSYFAGLTFEDSNGLDYYSGEFYAAKTAYSFQYTLAELMTAAMQAGFVLRHIEELDYDISFFVPISSTRPTSLHSDLHWFGVSIRSIEAR